MKKILLLLIILFSFSFAKAQTWSPITMQFKGLIPGVSDIDSIGYTYTGANIPGIRYLYNAKKIRKVIQSYVDTTYFDPTQFTITGDTVHIIGGGGGSDSTIYKRDGTIPVVRTVTALDSLIFRGAGTVDYNYGWLFQNKGSAGLWETTSPDFSFDAGIQLSNGGVSFWDTQSSNKTKKITIDNTANGISIEDDTKIGLTALAKPNYTGTGTGSLQYTTRAYVDSVAASLGGGVVVSVSGTPNRITSTGGITPVIDISATFEALLGKIANPLSQFASTTSSQLAGVISNETGSGLLVFGTSPSLTTPSLGVATATSINGDTFTTGTYTLTGAAGKTLTFNNSLILAGTDGSTLNIGGGGTLGSNAFTSTAYVPTTLTLTINGTTFDLSASRSWTVGSTVTTVSGEVPSGSLNGSNVTFTAAHTPIAGTLSITYNGLTIQPIIDYTFSGTTATLVLTGHFSSAPISTDYLLFNYQY